MKFKIGDQVRIVKYGHRIWVSEELVNGVMKVYDKPKVIDISFDLVGNVGIIIKLSSDTKFRTYGIHFPEGDNFWFHHAQLELIHRPAYITKED